MSNPRSSKQHLRSGTSEQRLMQVS